MEKFLDWLEANMDGIKICATMGDILIRIALLISAFHFIIKFW